MVSLKDNELIELLRNGDQASFSIIYDLYKDKVFAFAFVHTRSKETAEEIMQEVFLKLWEKRSQICVNHNFSGYIQKVAYNQTKDFFRSEAGFNRMHSNFIYVKESERLVSDNRYEAKEMGISYIEAVQRLPAQRKVVYLLNKEYGLSYQQIADELSISVCTVRNHLAKSVKFIRNCLAYCNN